MSIHVSVKNICKAFLAQRSGIPLEILLEVEAKKLLRSAPQGEEANRISIQPDGTTLRTASAQEDKDIVDELALRRKMGDIYANSLQQKGTYTLESISKHDMDIRDTIESRRENRERQDELLTNSPNYHFIKRESLENSLKFFVTALGEIGAMFFLFADLFGIDPVKIVSEFMKHWLAVSFTALFTIGYFFASLLIAEKILTSKRRVFWASCLAFFAATIAHTRAIQTAALQETDINTILLTVLYMIIGFVFPLVAAVYYIQWKEASQYVGRTDSTLRRLTEQEARYSGQFHAAMQEREQSQHQLNQIINEYVTSYQQTIEEKEKTRADWETYGRHIESNLAEIRLAYLFWQGSRTRYMQIPKPVKRILQITAILLLTFVLVLSSYLYANADNSNNFNMLVVCDRSSSADNISCTPGEIEQAGRLWIKKADNASAGYFDLFIINEGFDTTTILLSETYPERFPGPVTANKKKWRNDFFQRLTQATKTLPSNQGSAILEAIYRCSLRIPPDGETLVYIMSDMREVNDAFNFERRVPSWREFSHWIANKNIKPKFTNTTKIIICGVHPYTPDQTSQMTTQNYERLLQLWTNVFNKWGVKASISEACSLNK